MLGDGLAVIGGGVALLPWQWPLGLFILQGAGDVDAALAEPLAARQAALLLHHHRGVLGGRAEDRRALRSLWGPRTNEPPSPKMQGAVLLPKGAWEPQHTHTQKQQDFRHRAVPQVQRAHWRNFPDLPVVKTLRFHCREHRFDPWLGN